MVDGAAGADHVDAKLTRSRTRTKDENEHERKVCDEVTRGLGVRGGVTGVTRAVNIRRNEGLPRNTDVPRP